MIYDWNTPDKKPEVNFPIEMDFETSQGKGIFLSIGSFKRFHYIGKNEYGQCQALQFATMAVWDKVKKWRYIPPPKGNQ